MAISTKTGLKQTQKITLSQQLIQSINLLQLSNIELAEKISSELQDNPVLEEERTIKSPASDSTDKDSELISGVTKELSGDDSPLQKPEENDINYSESNFSRSSEEDKKRSFIENAITQEETLKEHLMSQAHLVTNNEKEIILMENIITALDDNGFLISEADEIAAEQNVPTELLKKMIQLINAMDPIGCGAKDMNESLAIQAEILYPDDSILQKILREHFLSLEKIQYEKITKALKISVDEIIEKNKLIQNLNPFPGRDYGKGEIKYIIPDIDVRLIDDEIYITLNDDWLPGIRINSYYRNLLKQKNTDSKLKQYVKDKMNSAKYLIDSISNRRITISKVAGAIMEYQRDFLVNGTGHLKPLVYSDIARETGLHESTISRVANNKYVQTSWGIFELKSFFVSKLKSDNEKNYSSDEVINLIKEIINNEDPSDTLTDEEIVNILKEKNINAARRTVAKYRGLLKIPPSNIRKKINILNNKK